MLHCWNTDWTQMSLYKYLHQKSFLLFNSYRKREHYDETRPSRNLLPQCSPCLYNFTWWAKHEGNNSRTYNRTFRGPVWINLIFLAPTCGIENNNGPSDYMAYGEETKVVKLEKPFLIFFNLEKSISLDGKTDGRCRFNILLFMWGNLDIFQSIFWSLIKNVFSEIFFLSMFSLQHTVLQMVVIGIKNIRQRMLR